MKDIKSVILGFVVLGLANGAWAVANNYASAEALKTGSRSVKLVEENDPWFGKTGMGVAWYKLTVKKGSEWTVWVEGANADKVELYCLEFPGFDFDFEKAPPRIGFQAVSMPRGVTARGYCLYKENWLAEDPASWTYYVSIYGDVGLTVTLGCENGIHSFEPEGSKGNPTRLTVEDTRKQTAGMKVLEFDGAVGHYFRATLQKDRKYVFETEGGQASAPLDIVWMKDLDVEKSAAAGNVSYGVYPAVSDAYVFSVTGAVDAAFTLLYRSVPVRAISAHTNFEDLDTEPSVKFVPGRMVAGDAFYDPIVDEGLCRKRLAKGERCVFETSGADRPLRMFLYDAKGNVLRENTSLGGGSLECRVAIEAPAAGYYYVGLCNPALGVDEPAPKDAAKVTVTAYPVTSFAGDSYDPQDDTEEGASEIFALPCSPGDDPTVVGEGHGGHVLNGGDWEDCFRIECRKGVDYSFKVKLDNEGVPPEFPLGAEVYRLDVTRGKQVRTLVETIGDVNWDSELPLTFKVTENGTYFVHLFVADFPGLDFPHYALYAAAYADDTTQALGILRVRTPGYAGAAWWIKGETTKYADGDEILIAGNPTVCFTGYSDFKTPADLSVSIGSDVTEAFGAYRDAKDPADDVAAKAVAIKPAAGEKTVRRTLWHAGEYGMGEDPADWFKFTATSGVFYNFALKDAEGDAVYSILDASFNPVPGCDSAVEPLQRLHLGGGTFYVKVEHAKGGVAGGAYSLVFNSANVGVLSFKSAKVSVKDTAANVKLVVKRSASDGRLRVRYATYAGTAKPGEQYYPVQGELVWEHGDKKDKTITIPLIPKLLAAYSENRDFTVLLTPLDADDLEAGEYLARFSGTDEAKVTITPATKAVPGTVAVTEYKAGESGLPVAIANVKKPAAVVTAGDPLVLTVTRANGTVGTKVAVQLTTANGKAVGGVDFEPISETLEWEADDDTPRTVTIQTKNAGFYVSSKAFSVKLKALTSGAYKGWSKPTISGSTVSVTLASPTVEMSLADYAKKIKSAGMTLKGSGTWVRRKTGSLECAPVASGSKAKAELTWTVNGPGVLTLEPEVTGDQAKLVYAVGKGAATEWTEGTVRLMLAKGSQAVKFTLTGEGASVAFKKQATGEPFQWLRFATVVPNPVNKAVVNVGRKALEWSWAAGIDADDVCVRVRFGTSSKNLDATVARVKGFSCPMPEIESGKTYYWTLDYALSNDAEPDYDSLTWTPSGLVWQFGVSTAQSPATSTEATDIWGASIEEGVPVALMQGIGASIPLVSSNGVQGTSAKLVAGKLPDGLKLKGTAVTGVPTKVGTYQVVLQLNNGKIPGETLALTIVVEGLESAAGTYSGVLFAGNGEPIAGLNAAASVSFTADAKGKLSASVSLGGKSYKFSSSTGFSEVLSPEAVGSPVSRRVSVALVNKTTVNKVSYENVLNVTVNVGSLDDSRMLGLTVGAAELTMNLPTADGADVAEVVYSGDVFRNNAKVAAYTAALSDFVGYYTVSLVPQAAEPGLPAGNGYLTITINAKGAAKITGLLADGAKVSLSSVVALIGELENPLRYGCRVPFFSAKSPTCLAGVLDLSHAFDEKGAPAPVVDLDSLVLWNKDGAQTYDGESFRLSLQPVGGWYNKLYNLQAYYLGFEFALQAGDYTLYEEPKASGYSYVGSAFDRLSVSLSGNAFSVPKQVLVKDPANKKLIDLAASVNPDNVVFKFTRATGIVSGSFSIWTESDSGQKEIKKILHYGVMPLSRPEGSFLDDTVVTAGFYLLPMKIGSRKWSASLPFNLVGEFVDPDWSEPERPVVVNE